MFNEWVLFLKLVLIIRQRRHGVIDLVVDFSKWPLHSFQVDVPCVIKKITGGGGDDIAYIYISCLFQISLKCVIFTNIVSLFTNIIFQ